MSIVQHRMRRFDRMIAGRNLLECIAAAVVMVFFGWAALHAPNPITRTGFLVIVASAAWIIFYMLRYGRPSISVDPSQSLTGYTRALVKSYDHQIRLLKSVKYWYLLPMYVGLLITSAGLFLQREKAGNLVWWDLGGPLVYTAVFAAVWWLNEVYSVGRLMDQRAKLLSITGHDELTRRKQ